MAACWHLRGAQERSWRERDFRRVLAAVVLCGLLALRSGSAFVGSRISSLGRPQSELHASYDKDKLMSEASFTEGAMRSFSDLFRPKEAEMTPEEVEEQLRQQASSAVTENAMQGLRLQVMSGEEDEEGLPIRRAAPISILQEKAKQSIVFFAVTKEKEQLITDVLLSMRIEAKDISERNLLLVPAIVDISSKMLLEYPPNIRDAKLMRQKSVALPVSSDGQASAWGELLAAEFQEADEQDIGDQVRQSGLALVVKSDGSIVRRGVGRPQWKVVFADTDE
mmetsp:Transcript_60587/g.113161  ORF Transcript_60587/g.113161 Transcript_60587/m.113161 type:complete len:280 (-) Transcript_60587:59-898(-)